MRKIFIMLAVAAMVSVAPDNANAQFGKGLLNKVKAAAQNAVSGNSSSTSRSSSGSSPSNTFGHSGGGVAQANSGSKGKGKTYYVSATGSGRADGLSPSTPKKDIQAVLNLIRDNNENGATVKVAEGNYLGYMNAGYIEIYNWITLEGGYSPDFSQRDPLKYITRIETDQSHKGTNGSKGLITLSKLDDVLSNKILGTVTIDGFMLNMGYENNYKPNDPTKPECGCPSKNFETGRMLDPEQQVQHQLLHSDAAIAGNVVIRNCMFLNGNYFGIQFNTRRGEIEISNCVFVSNRFSSVRIDGWDKKTGTSSHVNFHHNTVAFSWCRTKVMEDMGYGYEFMTAVNADVHHNIFLCNNYSALARTHLLSGPDAVIEAKRVTNIYDNAFFMNAADLQLPAPGGGTWTNVKCAQFDDLDEKTVPKVDGNFELQGGDTFLNAIDPDYLEAFSTLKIVSSSSFDRNSAANMYRSAHGQNMRGTEIVRPSMYGNRYKFDQALKLFGAKPGYGAQRP